MTLTLIGMSLVIANGFNPNKEDDRKRRGSLKREEATSCWTNISGPSHYTQVAPTRSISPLSPLPVEMLGSNEYQYPTIRRVEFAMELFKAGTEDVIHTYTTIQYVMASPSRPLEGLRNWRTLYPPLAVYYDQGQIDCPTFLFDTKLSLMEDVPGCNAVLSIQNFLDMTQGVKYTNWQSHTRFYEEEGRPVDLATFYKGSEFGNALVQLSVHPGARPTDCKLEGLPLKSAWWASTFSKMITQSLKAKATEDPNAMKTEEENIERYIRGISVMQEIYASSHAHGSKPKRMAILVWKFSKSRKGEAATTSWHRLIPPESAFQVQSPMPPQLQPHLTLDTTIENAVVQHPTAPYTDFYNPQPSLFADNAEELLDASLSDGSSPETPPPSDYASFPSSTSTSFPSNISNQAYPSHLAQGSSFQSQDSAYSSLASFASQDSHYHSQEMYDSQESLYHSQDALYHHQTSTQVYDWPTPHPLLTDDTAATQDFTGGKIHIAYPPDEESNFHHTYEPQLFAPRAGMTSQHQLIQHPEQFDHHDYLEPELASQGGDTTQCIDWQLIASQGVQVGDMRFQEGELGADGVVQWEQGLEQIVGGDGVEGQGQILGEVLEGGGEGEGGVEGELGAFH